MRDLCAIAVLMLGLAGCGSTSTTVSGTVNIKDRPVEQGYLTFFPNEGTKGTHSAEVKDGQYRATDIPAGQWRVQVTAMPAVEVVQKGNGPPLLKMPAKKGNTNVKPLLVEVRPGKQTLDLAF